jgi:hypothetical protein
MLIVQSKDKRIHDMPERNNVVEANGVLRVPDETGSEASQSFDVISNGNDDGIGEYDSFFEALEVAAPNGIDKYYAPSFE